MGHTDGLIPDDSRRDSLDARHAEAKRHLDHRRANPRTTKNYPSREADRGRPVVRSRGERRSS